MKKLFYIVAICTLLALITAYIKANSQSYTGPSPVTIVKTPEIPNADANKVTTEENAPVSSETTEEASEENKDCECETECICPENEPDCDCTQTKSTCSCKDANGDSVTVESIETNNSDIEELNPEQTSEEDETIIEE